MVLFGAGGITILVLAWAPALPQSERIVTICVGVLGLLRVLVRELMLMLARAKINVKKPLAEADAVK
ncbi:hypothetical protein ACFLYG_00460 [Chloroflexota bacterium]